MRRRDRPSLPILSNGQVIIVMTNAQTYEVDAAMPQIHSFKSAI
jgi:hypothetical protein